MKITKKLLSLSLSIFAVLILCTAPSYAIDSAPEAPSDHEGSISIDVISAIHLVKEKLDEETLKQLNDAVGAYLLDDGQVIFEFQHTITSCSSASDTASSAYIPIADNVNLFTSRSISGYTLQWSKSNELSHMAAEGYGVVNGYRSDTDSDLWYLEMRSNVRGSSYAEFVTQFRWEVSHDNSNTQIIGWSPSGTTVSTSNGVTLSVSLKLSNDTTASVSFPLYLKKTTVSGGVLGQTYSLSLENDFGITYPHYQDLNALVSYNTDGFTSWNWSWEIWAYQRY